MNGFAKAGSNTDTVHAISTVQTFRWDWTRLKLHCELFSTAAAKTPVTDLSHERSNIRKAEGQATKKYMKVPQLIARNVQYNVCAWRFSVHWNAHVSYITDQPIIQSAYSTETKITYLHIYRPHWEIFFASGSSLGSARCLLSLYLSTLSPIHKVKHYLSIAPS